MGSDQQVVNKELSLWQVVLADNYLTEMCSGSEAGSYLRLIDLCITEQVVLADESHYLKSAAAQRTKARPAPPLSLSEP